MICGVSIDSKLELLHTPGSSTAFEPIISSCFYQEVSIARVQGYIYYRLELMEVWNSKLLVAGGSWTDASNASETVRQSLIRRLAYDRSIPAMRGLNYWAAIPHSAWRIALFYLQNTPAWLLRFLKSPRDYFGRAQFSRLHFRSGVSIEGDNWLSAGIAYIVGHYRIAKNLASAAAVNHCNKKTHELEQVLAVGNGQIGKLLSVPQDAEAAARVKLIAISVDVDLDNFKSIETPEQALDALQYVLTSVNDKLNSQAIETIPPIYTRWWPAAVIIMYSLRALQGSWDLVIEWLHTSVLDTLGLFWRNWVIDPLYHIYLTIRHDPTSQLALIANESLDTDIQSLNKMVADFVLDNPGIPTNIVQEASKPTGSSVDMMPVMSAYESQLRQPILNLVTGQLVRTALIQIQKSKVDLEVALKGIDQLIQSQQLVFGIVAAVPAFLTLLYFSLFLNSRFTGKQLTRSKTVKQYVYENLGELDSMIRGGDQPIDDQQAGHVYCQVVKIKDFCSNDTNSASIRQVLGGLDSLLVTMIETRSQEHVMEALDRVYIRLR